METLTTEAELPRKLQIKDEKRVAESLSKKVVRGGIWMFSLRIASRVLLLVSTVILARLLAPGDFGLMGIALLAMGTIETFSQTGFETALVQKKGEIREYLDTVWVSLIIRGTMISAILYFSSPLVGIFFNAPKAIDLIKVIAFIPLINGIANIGVLYFQKELEFRKKFVYITGGAFTGTIATVYLAFLLRNVWALVYGTLAGCLAQFALSYLIHSYRPKFKFDWEKVKELFDFGKWIFILGIIVFLVTNVDNALVGKLLGMASLGFYTMAYKFSNFSCTEIAHVISQVSFPAYSKLQDNLPKLKEAYLKVLQIVALISIPLAGGIFVFAPEFTKIFLGDKWIPMVSAMRVLCIFGAVRSIQNTFGALFNGIGKPEIGVKIGIIQLVILSIVIFPFTVNLGIVGTAWAVSSSIVFSCILGVWEIHRLLKFSYITFVKILSFPIILVLILYLIIWAVRQRPFYESSPNWFFILLAASVSVYSLAVYLLNKIAKYGLGELISLIFKSI